MTILGSVAGIIGPLVVADFINKWDGVLGWRAMFLLTGIMTLITLLLWVIFQTSNIDPTINTPSGYSKKDKKEESLNL